MYIRKWTEKVMDGEPHLGSQTFSELTADPGEVEQAFYSSWAANGYSNIIYVADDYTEDDIELEAKDHFDVKTLQWVNEVLDDAETMGVEHTAETIQIAMKLVQGWEV